MKRLTIAKKINFIIISSIIIIALSIGFAISSQIEKALFKISEENLVSLLNSNYNYLDSLYEGEWSIQDGKLFKGNITADTMNTTLDKILTETGVAATIFLEDMRIATNVQTNGVRAIGTTANPKVSEKVLNGEMYAGLADVNGLQYLTAYQPIQDYNKKVIGMWFVGKPIEVINEIVTTILIIVYAVMTIVGALTVIISLLVVRKVVQPIRQMRQQLFDIAAGGGDLTQELHINSKDEIGDLAASFNQMLATLRVMMKEIALTTTEITASCEDLHQCAAQTTQLADNMTATLHTVADGAEVQRQITQESEDNINQLQNNIVQVVGAIQQADISSERSTTQVNYGNEAIHQIVKQMESIRWSVSESEKVIKQLGDQSKEIGSISDVITDIADQTNLLALNAAIEAARAGEHGKGFAVVADEVRHLAEQSKDSAHQIMQLITAVQINTEKAVQMMIKGSTEVNAGFEVVRNTEGAFTNIEASIKEVKSQFEQIIQLSNTMEHSICNVQKQTIELTSIADESATNTIKAATISDQELASMEEITTSAKSLENAAGGLQSLIHKFKF